MKPAARVQAAIEVLTDVFDGQRPAAAALADWGRAHRFAGSGDRAAIGNLVYDALRRKASAAYLMGDDTPRALALGTLRLAWSESAEAIAALADGSQHAPAALTADEQAALGRDLPARHSEPRSRRLPRVAHAIARSGLRRFPGSRDAGTERACASRSAHQHAAGHTRAGPLRFGSTRRPYQRRCRRSAFASRRLAPVAACPMSRPSMPTRAAGTRSRTRARRSRRC